ncbi:hypothetical protein HNY73_008314 [Argiope bruennichi]|uniref:Uncharacterized protein n=1 Tax=Argiope bruennichi TaxID=94029 RepID=A0A8T0F5Z9_ARGBR|nr:hypothetical protein HNY73_008314 [Argiope bruennichi]
MNFKVLLLIFFVLFAWCNGQRRGSAGSITVARAAAEIGRNGNRRQGSAGSRTVARTEAEIGGSGTRRQGSRGFEIGLGAAAGAGARARY